MSGFAGAISLDGAPPDSRLLKRMADQLAFRGPDAINVVVQPGAGFVFTFLRTGPAPQCPSQPCTLDGRVWLIGDIRLDGRNDLRLKLEQHGDRFDSDATDEELVLRAWRRWGENALPDLIGDYSFAIWDGEERHLICARDLIGARPFFYAQADGWLYFSNTLNAIRCPATISADLDPHFIGDFLLDGWCHDLDRTAFRDVHRLPAGHAFKFCSAAACIERHASLPIEEPLLLKSEHDYVDIFRGLFERAVLDRLPAGTASIFMSGGLDSTSVAAIACNSAWKTRQHSVLHAYTVDCSPVLRDDEGRLASIVAQFLGFPIELQQGTGCLPFQGWEGPRLFMPEPFHDPYRALYLDQAASISRRARVALNGYGGDGIMTGQAWPHLLQLVSRFEWSRICRDYGLYFLSHFRFPPLRGGFRNKILRFFSRTNKFEGFPLWLAPSFEKTMRLRDRWLELRDAPQKTHPWYPDAHQSLNAGLWVTVLENEDSGWTHATVECRAPLLDVRIQRFLLRVPPVPLCIDKELLRRAMRGLLPEEVRVRPKTSAQDDLLAFQINTGDWSPLPAPKPSNLLLSLVDWDQLRLSIQDWHDGSLWRDLRPFSLLYWEKGLAAQSYGGAQAGPQQLRDFSHEACGT